MITDIATIGVGVDSTGVERGKTALDSFAASGARAERSTESLAGSTAILGRVYRDLAAVIATLGVKNLVTESASLSQRYQELGIVLGVVSKNAGLVRSGVDAVTKAVREQGISMIESRGVITKMIQSQIDLSHATELATLAQNAAVIGQIGSSEALDRMLHGIRSNQIDVLRTIGINVNFEQSYKKLAKEINVSTESLSENQRMQARVNTVLDQAAAIQGVYAAAMENAGKQMRSTERLVEDLKVKVGGLFDQTSITAVRSYTNILKELDERIDMLTESGELKLWGDDLARTFAFMADTARNATNIIGGLIATAAVNIESLMKGDFRAIFEASRQASVNLRMQLEDSSKYRDELEHQIIVRDMLTKAEERNIIATKQATEENNKKTASEEDLKKAADARDKAQQKSLRIESDYVKLLEHERKLRDDMIKPYRDSAKEAEERAVSMRNEVDALRMSVGRQIDLKEAIERTTIARLEEKKAATKDSGIISQIDAEISARRRMLDMMPEYKRLEQQNREASGGISQMWVQTGRNIQTALGSAVFDFWNDGLDGMVRSASNAAMRIMSELAGLKIAESIGLASMFSSAGAGMAGSGGILSGNGGISAIDMASMGSNLMSLARGGFGMTSLVGSGISGLGSLFGSSGMSAFGAGFAGDAIGGLAAGGFTSGAASMASMGASMAAFAGPAMIALAVTQGLKALAGDKRMGGGFGNALNAIGDIPVIGDMLPIIPLLNSLFGRGPLKQQGTLLSGEVGAEGFESGYLQTRFKAKGGLFRSDKIDYARVDAVTGEIWTDNDKLLNYAEGLSKAGKELFDLINDTTKQTSSSLRQIADDMGLSTAGIDNFSYSINLLSEKGKMLSEEQIGEEVGKITESLAHGLLPQVDELGKRGESALQTVSRLGIEFASLVSAATIVLGKSSADARSMIMGSSFDGRTAFLDKTGGVDAFNQQAQFFSNNFLSESTRLGISTEALNAELSKLGLSADLSRSQFTDLVQSFGSLNGISEDMLVSLLKLAPAFDLVRDAEEARAQAVSGQRLGLETQLLQLEGDTAELRKRELAALDPANRALQERIWAIQDESVATQTFNAAISSRQAAIAEEGRALRGVLDTAFDSLRRSVDSERRDVELHIGRITQNLDKLRSLSAVLQGTLGRMTIAGSEGDQRAFAQAQISSALAIARAGGILPDAATLQRSLDIVAQPSMDLYGSFVDYMRDFARTSSDINSLDIIARDQIGTQESALQVEQNQLLYLDGILTSAQAQIDAINGVDTRLVSISQALQGFGAAISAVKANAATASSAPTGTSSSVLGGSGNPSYSNKDIIDYIDSGVTPDQILAKALETGVSAKQISIAMKGRQGWGISSIRDFVQSRGLIPGFASGGVHMGGLRIVGEGGPELEYTPPSRIFSNSDSRKIIDLTVLVDQLKLLRKEIKADLAAVITNTGRAATILDDSTAGGGPMLVEVV